jgi:triacylglycerol lipase
MARDPKNSALVGLLAVLAAGFTGLQAGEYQVSRDVTYVERGGRPLAADVLVPNEPGPLPAVLLVHGGAWRMGSKPQMERYARALAAAGFVSVSINYRLAPEHRFPAQIEDCKSAVRWMRKNAGEYKIDPERIGALGYSAGGHLVALLGTTDAASGLEGPDADGTSTRLTCVVAGGAPCDFRRLPRGMEQLSYWLGGTRGERPDAYELASPAKFVTRDDPPMLLFHGEEDRLVPVRGPRLMTEHLISEGVSAELYLVPAAGHIQAFIDGAAQERAIKFLTEHLKRAASARASG